VFHRYVFGARINRDLLQLPVYYRFKVPLNGNLKIGSKSIPCSRIVTYLVKNSSSTVNGAESACNWSAVGLNVPPRVVQLIDDIHKIFLYSAVNIADTLNYSSAFFLFPSALDAGRLPLH